MMQGEEACHMKKQMRDIPETLQDKMGQKMRLTVNGFAVKSSLPGYNCIYINTTVPHISKSMSYLCTYSKPFLSTDAE